MRWYRNHLTVDYTHELFCFGALGPFLHLDQKNEGNMGLNKGAPHLTPNSKVYSPRIVIICNNKTLLPSGNLT